MTLAERGLDFADAALVFSGVTGEQGWKTFFAESSQADLAAPARRCDRTLEGHGPGLADAHGRTPEQGAVKKPQLRF